MKKGGQTIWDSHSGGTVGIVFTQSGNYKITCQATVNNYELPPAELNVTVYPTPKFIVKRHDYEVDKNNNHINYVVDNSAIYIHWNIDDDDWSAKDKETKEPTADYYGCDCDQKEFNRDIRDDDLCEIFIDPIDENGIETGILKITVPTGYRLWKSDRRNSGSLLIDSKGSRFRLWNLSDPSDRQEIGWNNNTGTKLYIECCIPNEKAKILSVSYNNLKIGDFKYLSCAAGNKFNQPNKQERKLYMSILPGLIGCEWFVIRDKNNKDNHRFNCISYAVDPYKEIINNYFWVNTAYSKEQMNLNLHAVNLTDPSLCLYAVPSGLGFDNLYYTSMDQFSPTRYNRIFDNDEGNDNDIDSFFLSGYWGLTEKCSSKYDTSAKVIYYKIVNVGGSEGGFHAARNLKYTNYKLPNNYFHRDWKMFVSKCRENGVIVHRMEQIELMEHKIVFENEEKSITAGYGELERAYK